MNEEHKSKFYVSKDETEPDFYKFIICSTISDNHKIFGVDASCDVDKILKYVKLHLKKLMEIDKEYI